MSVEEEFKNFVNGDTEEQTNNEERQANGASRNSAEEAQNINEGAENVKTEQNENGTRASDGLMSDDEINKLANEGKKLLPFEKYCEQILFGESLKMELADKERAWRTYLAYNVKAKKEGRKSVEYSENSLQKAQKMGERTEAMWQKLLPLKPNVLELLDAWWGAGRRLQKTWEDQTEQAIKEWQQKAARIVELMFPPKGDTPTEEVSDGLSRPFPAECLPITLRNLANNVAEATGTPAVISYAAGLSAIAASLGSNLRVETKKGEFIAGNLFIIPIVDSGIGKSRASKFMLRTLYQRHDQKQAEWEETSKEIRAELDAISEEIDNLKKRLKGVQEHHARQQFIADLAELYGQKENYEKMLIKPELYTGSTTEAKLAALLRDNNEVMNAISTEAGAAVQILAGKYNNAERGTIKTEDSLLLSSYCQERYKNDRLTTDSVELRGPTVNLLWMVQPRYIPTLFGNSSLASGGFLARCLPFNSHAEPKEETGLEPDVDEELLRLFTVEIGKLFNYFENTKAVIKPSHDAKEVMRNYFNECVRLRVGSLRDIQQFPARWRENAWKIAVCLHAMAYGTEAGKFEMPKKIAVDAVTIMRWFSNEFLLLMRAGREDQSESDATSLLDYINRKGVNYQGDNNRKSISIRDIVRNRGMKSEDIRLLVKRNPQSLHIRTIPTNNGGSPSERVFAGRLPDTR